MKLKSGEVSNYRGVVLLSAIPKLFEKLMSEKLEAVLVPLINPAQHGFEKGKSTCTNLALYVSELLEGIESGGQMDAIYTDFSKAFDRVHHDILLRKLELAGVDGNVIKWLKCYLTGRTQLVKLPSAKSRPILVSSGVVQGSHLGPLLFSLFINDLCEQLEDCGVLLYADDMKLYKKINGPGDSDILQRELDKVVKWCEVNMMALNADKCESITFKRASSSAVLSNYCIGGHTLKRVSVVKDLGVLLDTRLTFKPHIDHVISKAKSTLYFVKVLSKDFQCPYVTKRLYESLVRSTVEYCSIVWAPHLDGDINRLESIQKQFLLFALRHLPWSHRFRLPSYESRLSLLNMDTLEDRRKLAAVCFVHRSLSGGIKVPQIVEKFRPVVPARHTRNAVVHRLQQPSSFAAAYIENAPLRRCIHLFNQYAECYGVSFDSFKRKVRAKFLNDRRIRNL